MAKKKRPIENSAPTASGYIKGAGEIQEMAVTDVIESNYMPYAMSVILGRALPEIDGFKPSHRKLLYTMFKMGLLGGARQKSSKIAGTTMTLNPHGDAAIYETMVRMTTAYEALLHPYVDSKGSFGKAYSRDTAPAASRYTEARLAPIAEELFRDINSDAVDMVPNFDNTEMEPTLLPVTFPSILTNTITGIAVSMASSICSFNLNEVVETTIALMRDPQHDIASTLLAPDFPGGGFILADRSDLANIYATGKGSVRVRAKYSYDKSANCVDITEIPPSTTVEQIIEKVIDLVKQGKLKEISDIRDETGQMGLRLSIDLKRGVDPEKLMAKLFRMTSLEDNFPCNFNVLIGGHPMVLGVGALLEEWIAFRSECVRRRVFFELKKREERLHLLLGLEKILLDIDKAIRIIRETDEESEVVPNLMIGFGIDEIQAEYVAEIKLRHLNREYILKRTADIERLREEIADRKDILESRQRIKKIIAEEMRQVAKKYGQDRRSVIIYNTPDDDAVTEEEVPDYPVFLFFTQEGYFKKITPQSLRMSGEQKLKEGDVILRQIESHNNVELLFFTDRCQVYKSRASDFSDTKASVMGDFIAAKLGMDEGESVVYMAVVEKYEGYMLFAFENGKLAKVELSAYATKTNRKKLVGAYSDKSPLCGMLLLPADSEVLLTSSSGRRLLVHTGAVTSKTTRDTQGIQVMTQRKGHRLMGMELYAEDSLPNAHRYRARSLPAAGALPSAEEKGAQTSILDDGE
ncbi:MAG: topoisomerase IV [Ruminococcaceae bacterium]|nr:topoisomerase IV [Oscillospiraceae bacterium]